MAKMKMFGFDPDSNLLLQDNIVLQSDFLFRKHFVLEDCKNLKPFSQAHVINVLMLLLVLKTLITDPMTTVKLLHFNHNK